MKVCPNLPGRFKIPTSLGTYNSDWAAIAAGENTAKFRLATKLDELLVEV